MVELPLPLPKLDVVGRGKKIADSTTLNWIYRGGMIVACGMIVYFSKGTFETVQADHVTLTSHTSTIENVQATLNEVKAEVSPDHDAITILKTQMENVLDQIAKLWQRPAAPRERQPPP